MLKRRSSERNPPPCPEERTFSLVFRYVTTKHADAAAYKDHVVVTMPSDREWMSPRDARRLAKAIIAAATLQERIDAWSAKHEPQSYHGKQARRRAGMARRTVKP